MANETTQKRLLSKRDLTLKSAMENGLAMEMAAKDTNELRKEPGQVHRAIDVGNPTTTQIFVSIRIQNVIPVEMLGT